MWGANIKAHPFTAKQFLMLNSLKVKSPAKKQGRVAHE